MFTHINVSTSMINLCACIGAYGCSQNADARGTLEWNPYVRDDLDGMCTTIVLYYMHLIAAVPSGGQTFLEVSKASHK